MASPLLRCLLLLSLASCSKPSEYSGYMVQYRSMRVSVCMCVGRCSLGWGTDGQPLLETSRNRSLCRQRSLQRFGLLVCVCVCVYYCVWCVFIQGLLALYLKRSSVWIRCVCVSVCVSSLSFSLSRLVLLVQPVLTCRPCSLVTT